MKSIHRTTRVIPVLVIAPMLAAGVHSATRGGTQSPPASQPATQPDRKPGDMPALPEIPEPSTETDLFVQRIEKAHGGEKWDRQHAVRADIVVTFGALEMLNGTMTYEMDTGRSRFELAGGAILVFDGDRAWIAPAEAQLDRARFHLLTWPYFLAVPFKLDDPGTNLEMIGVESLNLRLCEAARLSFDAGVGDTPDDWYLVYSDLDTHRLSGLVYIVTYGVPLDEANRDPHAVIYSGYRSVSGVKIPSTWTFYKWHEQHGIDGPPIGRARLDNIEFITPEDDLFDRPANAREDRLPGS